MDQAGGWLQPACSKDGVGDADEVDGDDAHGPHEWTNDLVQELQTIEKSKKRSWLSK